MTIAVDSVIDLYARCYSEANLEGLVGLCLTPFAAVRRGSVEHMPDRGAVTSHFAGAIDAYRRTVGARTWLPQEIDTRHLGEHSAFVSVHWNAFDKDGEVVRDTWTSYQLLSTPDGWRFVSYTNHF